MPRALAFAALLTLAQTSGCHLILEPDPAGDAGSHALSAGGGGGAGLGGGWDGGGSGGGGGTDGGSGGGSPTDAGPGGFLVACRAYYDEYCAIVLEPAARWCPPEADSCEDWAVSVERGSLLYDAKALERCREGLVKRARRLAVSGLKGPVRHDDYLTQTDLAYRPVSTVRNPANRMWPNGPNGHLMWAYDLYGLTRGRHP